MWSIKRIAEMVADYLCGVRDSMRPVCYENHDCSAATQVLNNCDACRFQRECWEDCE